MTVESHRWRFGDFEFDASTGELTGPSGTTRLQPQPAQVLALLLTNAGRLVTRDEIRDQVWKDTTIEFDQSLHYCIRQIRAALGENADAPRYLETLPRRGYRMALEVEPKSNQRKVLTWALALAAVLVGVSVWSSSTGDSTIRIAILPLPRADSATGDLTERLIVGLTAIDPRTLAVIGPATTGPYRNDRRPQTEIGAELGVDFIMSGGRTTADSIFFVQLIRVSDGGHVYARLFAEEIANTQEVVDEMVRGLVEAVGIDFRF